MRLVVLSASLALLGGLSLASPEAQAQTPCPAGPGPGEVIIGQTDVGGSMQVPLCGRDGATGPDGDGGGSRFDHVEYERRQANAAFASILREGADVARQAEELLAEARRRRDGLPATSPSAPDAARGAWAFPPSAYCAAAFTSPNGLVSITGPGPDEPGVFLTFWSTAIPRPRSPQQVRIRLQQTGDAAPQSVRAMNYDDRGLGLGGIIVAVPSTDALLDNMLDDHAFRMWVGNNEVVNLAWNNGLSARDHVRRCLVR